MTRKTTDIRQEEIKQAVLDIIYTDGLKNLSTHNLAKRIGMSEGSIFRHFPTKQDIILSIINDVQNDFIGQLTERFEFCRRSGNPLEKFYLCHY